MFSMTTMASSTTNPVASVMPNRVSVLMENPSSLTKAKVPISETGIVTDGMIVLRQSSRNTKITRMTRTMASIRVTRTSRIDSPTASVRVEGVFVFHSGREVFREPIQLRQRPAIHVKRVRVRELQDRDTHRGMPVVDQVRAVVLRSQFGPAHILEPDQGSVSIRLENNVFELRRLAEPANGAHADLKLLSGLDWRLSYLAGSDFHILLLQGVHHVAGGEAATCHANRIQPQTHRVLAFAEDDDVGNSGHSLQRVFHVHVQVVAHEQRIVAVVRRVNAGAENEVARRLGDRDAGGFDRVRETSLGGVHPVLNVHGGQIGIAIEFEGRDNVAGTIVAAVGGHVLHSLRAVDLLLQRNGDRRLHCLCAGANVPAAHGDLRRREVGELRDRQGGNYDGARENDQQCADGCEYRAAYEEVNEHGKSQPLV